MMIRFLIILLSFLVFASCSGTNANSAPVKPIPIPSDKGSIKERRMAALIRGHRKQNRPQMLYDNRLGAVARMRARDMGQRNYFSHVDPDGYGANRHIARTGYRLPQRWLAFKSGNSGESILGGGAQGTARAAFDLWMRSSGHKRHVLASNPFYQKQTRFGIGYAHVSGSRLRHYWVFITAPPEK